MEQPKFVVEKRVEQLMEGKPEIDLTSNRIEQPKELSAIEEARILLKEIKEGKEALIKERERLENIHAQALLGGKSLLGNQAEKTKEQIAEETARNILNIYGK